MGSSADLPRVGPVGRAAFVEGYGLAESAGAVAMKARLPFPGLAALGGDAVGVPLPGVRFRIREGELELKAPGVTSGYWGDAAAIGGGADRGRLAADGRPRRRRPLRHGPLPGPSQGRHQGRRLLGVRRGGGGGAGEAPGRRRGRRGGAAGSSGWARFRVRPSAWCPDRGGGPAVEPDELLAEAASDLAAYKRPRRLVMVDDLPRTGTGKVQKDRLRSLFSLHRRAGLIGRLQIEGERAVVVDEHDDPLGVRQLIRRRTPGPCSPPAASSPGRAGQAVGGVPGRPQREDPPALEVAWHRRGRDPPAARRRARLRFGKRIGPLRSTESASRSTRPTSKTSAPMRRSALVRVAGHDHGDEPQQAEQQRQHGQAGEHGHDGAGDG